jgi:outer membrane protein assembly factor BamB
MLAGKGRSMSLKKNVICAMLLVLIAAASAHAENWPQWRGPFFNGSTTEKALPTGCDASTQLWVTDLPGHASATPIVWGDRVFISATDPATKGVVAMCLSAADGKVLWQKRVGDDLKAPNNDAATPSPCTDGRLAYFLYGTGDLAAFDFAGKAVWSRNVVKDYGNPCIKYGYSSSPLLYGGRLYIEMIRRARPHFGEPGADKPLEPYLLAIDAATGKDLWRHIRSSDADDESLEAYTTPMPYDRGGKAEIVLVGGDYLTGHDPATGREFWRFGYNPSRRGMWRLVPGSVAWEDLIYFAIPRGKGIWAAKVGGTGKLGEDAVAWKFDSTTTDSATPLVYDNSLYVLDSDRKTMVCFDPRTGKERWRGDLKTLRSWRASPTGADGKIYCLSEEGEVAVLAAGGEFKILSRTKLGDGPTQASIAAAGGRVFVRTATKLFCFGKPAK